MINALQASTGSSNVLWARNWVAGIMPATDTLDTLTDRMISSSEAPVPTYPVNGTKININSISGAVSGFTFQWSAPASKANTPGIAYDYDIYVYLDAAGTIQVNTPAAGAAVLGGAGSVANTLSVAAAAATLNPANAVPGQTYYWQIRANTGSPATSFWSPMQSFTIQQLTAIVPTIASPVSGATSVSTTPAFSWSPISGATSYRFELATDAAFTDIVYTVDPTSAGAGVTDALTADTQYFWRVKALTPNEGEWSSVGNFITAAPAAVVEPTQSPEIGSPVNGSTITSLTPGFSWTPITGADKYRFMLASDASFTSIVYTVDTTSAGAAVPSTSKLTAGTMYFWKVKVLEPVDGEWSTVANFMVTAPTTSAPQVTITTAPQATVIISQPAATTTVITVPAAEEKVVNPSYIWAIIIIGAVLVIAVIALIVRTRRSV